MVNQIRRNGSFAPLSAHYYDDDAVIAAGEKAEVLYLRSLASGVTARAQRLVEAGLWERVDGGYRITAWLKHNASKAEIEEKQRRDAARKRGGPREDS